MNRDALLLGFLATSGQVLLLRELMSAFGGAELFIGTALFGWLLWVVLGAMIGGARIRLNIQLLFFAGAILLPGSIVGIRFLPLFVTNVMGEMIPLTTAAPLSMLAMAPVGLVSGLLFPIIARQGRDSGDAVASVYLFEGLGAFVAGVAAVALVSLSVGNLGASLVAAATVALLAGLKKGVFRSILLILSGSIVLLLAVTQMGASLDRLCDQRRYPGYLIKRSFDTPYGHQTVLQRDSSTVLVTDNAVEAVAPDLERTENLLIPPLAYCPSATSALFLGRAEFGMGQLAAQVRGLRVTAVDPRDRLTECLDARGSSAATRVDDDPVAFLGRTSSGMFDVIIVSLGHLDSYRTSRLVTPDFLERAKRHLNPQGVLLLATSFDTDRYVSPETGQSLAMIVSTMRLVFPHTTVWPGAATLLLASEADELDLRVDSILSRIARLAVRTQYVSEAYLGERLGEFKRQRLQEVLAAPSPINSVQRPVLAFSEAWRRAKASELDSAVAGLIFHYPLWLFIIAVGLALFFFWTMRGLQARRVGLHIYFTAGLVSLSLELISFYLFQSTVGSLHLHLAVLIAVFMLGLSLGTWLAARTIGLGIGRLSSATLLVATIVLGLTWDRVDFRLALIYHALFLFVVALCTGALFVAATRFYYAGAPHRSRGTGYALELAGSAVGALLTNAVLIPILGLYAVLAAVAVVLAATLITQIRGVGSRPILS